jgi:hypothetical protein
MRTSAPDALPLFRSEFQVELLALLLLNPDRAWTIPQMAENLGAPISSVHRELSRAERAGIVDREDASRPHTFSAAMESPLYEPLAELLELTVGVEGEQAPGREATREAEPSLGLLGQLVDRLAQPPRPQLCQRLPGVISPRRVVGGLLRRASNLAGLA